MSDPIEYTRGDRSPSLRAKLRHQGGAASSANLEVGTTVLFRLALVATGVLKFEAAAVIEDAATGTVRYDWTSTDLDTSGRYRGEFRVTRPDGSVETFPSDSAKITIVVNPRVDDPDAGCSC